MRERRPHAPLHTSWRARRAWVFPLAAAALAAAHAAGAAPSSTLTVFAAASLTDAFNAAVPAFERSHPGIRVRVNYGASSALRVQIEQGSPADLFASADAQQLDPLVRAGIAGPSRTIARNRLVIAVPAGRTGAIQSPKELARPGLRLVSTSEAVPIGRYTREVLQRLAGLPGYPKDFPARVNANVVSREANVRAVLARVELGEADAALVYESDARASRRVRRVALPEQAQVTAAYPAAVIASSRHRGTAEAFLSFLLSAEGQSILKRAGFLPAHTGRPASVPSPDRRPPVGSVSTAH